MAYRHLQATKRVGGKVRRYKNLAAFSSECSTRGIQGVTSNRCVLKNLRCLRDGGGLATVESSYPYANVNTFSKKGKSSGTWLLHFADCGIMKQSLRNRVQPRDGRAYMLSGARRRRRRR